MELVVNNMKKFLDLGKQPIANAFIEPNKCQDEFFYDLEVGFDKDTKLVSHMEFVDPPLMFNDSYVYHTSSSKTMIKHFEETAKMIQERFGPDRVLEIGSNASIPFSKKICLAVLFFNALCFKIVVIDVSL